MYIYLVGLGVVLFPPPLAKIRHVEREPPPVSYVTPSIARAMVNIERIACDCACCAYAREQRAKC